MTSRKIIANRYELGDRIGSGAMGEVYRATDTRSGDTVAVKALKPDLVASNPDLLARFQREGEALRELNHPNIVAMREAVEQDGDHYLIMEYVSGGSLHDLLSEHPQGLPVDQTLTIAIQLADALTRSHFLNIIHRDLKPANVLIAEDGTPRLSDFGIALHREGERLTDTQAIIGTMDYIAPEVINGEGSDTRTDIWAFGVMFFEMLAGHRPFGGDTLVSLFASILSEAVPDLEALRPDCPVGLVDVVYRMLVKDPQGRIPSVRLVGSEIEALLTGIEIPERSRGRRHTGDPLFDTPLPGANDHRRHLPIAATPFIGRKHELEAIAAQMEECRLLTLLGPGGMGKTRLSIEAAARLADHYARGAHFVGLAPISAPDQIVPTIAEAVGFQFYAGGEPQQQLFDYLREKEMLLLLDNFEHVLEGVGFVSAMLDAAPHVKVIATSRERLKLSSECVFDVPGLGTPRSEHDIVLEDFEAVEMFVTYARRVQPGYELRDEDKPAIVRICQLVGGMPLGIELAAGWARSLAPQEIADELEADLDLLSTEMVDIPERQRSMRAAFEYSWRLLTDEEQDAFMKFSVFRGGATREAAQTVTGASMRSLTSLVDKSMLRRNVSSGRFEVHELMRQFSAALLNESGHFESVYDAHSDYYSHFVHDREGALKGHGQVEALQAIGSEQENVRAAFLWAISAGHYDWADRALNGITICFDTIALESLFGAAEEALKTSVHDVPQRFLMRLATRQAEHLKHQHHLEEAQTLLLDNLVQTRLLGDRWEEALVLWQIGHTQWFTDYADEETLAYARQSAAIFEELGDLWGVALAQNLVGLVVGFQGHYEEAADIHHRNLELRQSIGDRLGEAVTLNNLAMVQRMIPGSSADTIALMEHALRISRDMQNLAGSQFLLANLGGMTANNGDYEKAEAYILENLDISADLGLPVLLANAHERLATIYLYMGKNDQARTHALRSLEIARPINDRLNQYEALWILQWLAFEAGDHDLAYSYAREAEALGGVYDRYFVDVDLLLGEMACAEGDTPRAWVHFRRVLDHHRKTIAPISLASDIAWISTAVIAEGRLEQALEILSFTLQQPGWVPFWKERAQHLFDETRARLPAEIADAAIERGKSLDLDTIVQRLLTKDLRV